MGTILQAHHDVSMFAAKSGKRYALDLCRIDVSRGVIEATDGKYLISVPFPDVEEEPPIPMPQVYIPAASLRYLLGFKKDVVMCLSDECVRFCFNDTADTKHGTLTVPIRYKEHDGEWLAQWVGEDEPIRWPDTKRLWDEADANRKEPSPGKCILNSRRLRTVLSYFSKYGTDRKEYEPETTVEIFAATQPIVVSGLVGPDAVIASVLLMGLA